MLGHAQKVETALRPAPMSRVLAGAPVQFLIELGQWALFGSDAQCAEARQIEMRLKLRKEHGNANGPKVVAFDRHAATGSES